MDFLQTAAHSLALEKSKPVKFDLNLQGFLWLANESQMPELLENQRVQKYV